jgi:hypothetical protein
MLVATIQFWHDCLSICIKNPRLGHLSGVAHDFGIALASIFFLYLHMLYNIASWRMYVHMHGPQLHDQSHLLQSEASASASWEARRGPEPVRQKATHYVFNMDDMYDLINRQELLTSSMVTMCWSCDSLHH